MNIKRYLKSNKYIYNFNAFVKAAKTRKKLNDIFRYYSHIANERKVEYQLEAIPEMVRKRIEQRGISLSSASESRIRIFWVGANKEQDNSGFLQGLKRFGEVIQFHNMNGKYGQEFYSGRYDPKVVSNNSNRLLELIDDAVKNTGKVDVLIGQMWANFISVDALKRIQDMGIITVNISMDDRLPELWEKYKDTVLGSIGLVDGLDLVLTSCPDCCIRYLICGCPALFWPMASDPNLFKPTMKKDIEVCFVGNNYGSRGSIIGKLQRNGVNVEAFGSGWPNGYIGPLEIANIFGRSKIILGIGTIAYNKDIYTLKLRDFDATMAGALYITHRNPDLVKLFTEGKEIECYLTEEEAIEKISYYMKHPELREKIAATAAIKARKYHTWEIRIAEAFKTLGLTDNTDRCM